jgi:hypothetical protein
LQKQLVTQAILPSIWIRHWGITFKKTNPPNTVVAIPDHLDYLQRYVMDDSYIRRPTDTESGRTYKRIYAPLQYYNNKVQEPREMRVLQTNHGKDWKTIWNNLHSAAITEGQRVGWYKIIHDLQATNTRY